jgi:hypothetical protein
MPKGHKLKLISGGAGVGQNTLPFSGDGVQVNKGTARQSFWIRVEDELPEECETVLVLTDDYAFGYGYWVEKNGSSSFCPGCARTKRPRLFIGRRFPAPHTRETAMVKSRLTVSYPSLACTSGWYSIRILYR